MCAWKLNSRYSRKSRKQTVCQEEQEVTTATKAKENAGKRSVAVPVPSDMIPMQCLRFGKVLGFHLLTSMPGKVLEFRNWSGKTKESAQRSWNMSTVHRIVVAFVIWTHPIKTKPASRCLGECLLSSQQEVWHFLFAIFQTNGNLDVEKMATLILKSP